jgi:site-specific DNA recombinase
MWSSHPPSPCRSRIKRSVHMLISLAFVAPDIIEALIAGRLPRGIGITRLADVPPSWAKQRKLLGISNRSPRDPNA